MHADVAWVVAAQQPDVTASVSSPSRFPMPLASSFISTNWRPASSIARLTSGSVVDPLMQVFTPRQLITGFTPIDS
jgi:hypothetical protein